MGKETDGWGMVRSVGRGKEWMWRWRTRRDGGKLMGRVRGKSDINRWKRKGKGVVVEREPREKGGKLMGKVRGRSDRDEWKRKGMVQEEEKEKEKYNEEREELIQADGRKS